MVRRPLAAACAAAAIITSSGCLSLVPKQAHRHRPADRASPDGKPTTAQPFIEQLAVDSLKPAPEAPVVPQEDPAIAIDALRRKSESYARSLEALLAQRNVEGSPFRASAVQWLNPREFQLSLGAHDDSRVKPAEAIGKSEPRPNRDPAATGPADTQTFSDASNLPLELADVIDKTTVAAVTPERVARDAPLSLMPSKNGPADSVLSAKLTKRVKENPRDVAGHLEYQMLLFLQDEQVPNLASIATLPQEDRELVTAILDGLSNVRSTLRRDGNLMIAEKIRPIVELSDRLKTSAELTVPTLALAKRVEGFGRYETMDARLIAGKETPAIIYCEIENFSSQMNTEQMWETNLSMEVALFHEMGPQVFTDSPATIADTSRSRRHDFFVRKLIKFPSNLTMGRYVLKVTMVDTQSNRVAETSLPLQVVAQ